MKKKPAKELHSRIEKAVFSAKIADMHTHLFTPRFGDLLLWGIDELLTYHYLVAETFRWHPELDYARFWKMSKEAQADLVWKTLFIDNTPCSEACRGVLTVLQSLGLDTQSRNLKKYRAYFRSRQVDKYVQKILDLAGVSGVVMTNDPFDAQERPVWKKKATDDRPDFHAALRLDTLLNQWPEACRIMRGMGYQVTRSLSRVTQREIRKFLKDWAKVLSPVYMAASLPPHFRYPEKSVRGTILKQCVIPFSRDAGIPFAMMVGVKKLVNPQLQVAGDSVGKSHIETIEHLCAEYPDNRFLVTMLSRENQHELCVAARKFRNLMVFGCWWFLNNPSIIEAMTRQRIELLGLSHVPQHSDARVLDQLVYKWSHFRTILANVMFEKYSDLSNTGWVPSLEEIKRDVARLVSRNFWDFVKR